MSQSGPLLPYYTAKGLVKYQMEVSHSGLHKHQVIQGDSQNFVLMKARMKREEWDEIWEKRQSAERSRNHVLEKKRQTQEQKEVQKRRLEERKEEAEERTVFAQSALSELQNILQDVLTIDVRVDWNSLKATEDYPIRKPVMPSVPPPPPTPSYGQKPDPQSERYNPKLGLLDRLIRSRRESRESEARELYQEHHMKWESNARALHQNHVLETQKHQQSLEKLKAQFAHALEKWKKDRTDFLIKREEENRLIDEKRERYLKKDVSAIYDYCDIVLSRSQYPDFFPKDYEIEFREDASLLIVDYQLPPMEDFPRLREVKYVASRDEFDEKLITPAELERVFDSVVYQVTLRTLYELFKADMVDALLGVVFNGIVHSIDPATGQEVSRCIVSLHASKEEFMGINLANVEPKACFRKLKGVGSSKLHSLTPVAPVIAMEREDKRFVESYAVAQTLDEGSNLALMDWEDFEHLIREIFEKEFAAGGGEVKVTQASRDGGVDAVVFDPDPIRGGKIVIQAKRYTNTVGVSAVRDLYGTLLNEGANKGILVSTSDYGPDAYDFAKGKPITLLSGGNLLHLLQKHGHKAHIDIKAAKEAFSRESG